MKHYQVVAMDEHADVILRFDITRVPITIGRGPDNDLQLRHRSVSTKHAKIEERGGVWKLIDVGSTNGIAIDEVKVHELDLKDQLRVQLGQVVLEFEELADAHESTVIVERQRFNRPRSAIEETKFLVFALLGLMIAKFVTAQWSALTDLSDPESVPSLIFEVVSLALACCAAGAFFSLVSKVTTKRFQLSRLIAICLFVASLVTLAPISERLFDYVPNNSWREFLSRFGISAFVFVVAFTLSQQVWARLNLSRHVAAATIAAILVFAFSYRDTFIPQKSEVIYPRNLAIPYPLNLPAETAPPDADVRRLGSGLAELFRQVDEDRKDRLETNARVESNREKM